MIIDREERDKMLITEWVLCLICRNKTRLKIRETCFEFIPIESQIEKFQNGYYQAITACHVEGTSKPRIISFQNM